MTFLSKVDNYARAGPGDPGSTSLKVCGVSSVGRRFKSRDEMGKKSKSNTPAAEPAAVAASASSSDVFTVPSAEKVPTSNDVAAHWGQRGSEQGRGTAGVTVGETFRGSVHHDLLAW